MGHPHARLLCRFEIQEPCCRSSANSVMHCCWCKTCAIMRVPTSKAHSLTKPATAHTAPPILAARCQSAHIHVLCMPHSSKSSIYARLMPAGPSSPRHSPCVT